MLVSGQLTGAFRRTPLTVPPPGGPLGTAALLLGDLHASRLRALGPVVHVVALVLSDVDALHGAVVEDVAVGTRTESSTVGVGADAVLADSWIDDAFVDVFAQVRHRAQFVTIGTAANERTHHVGAPPGRKTSSGDFVTLVDVSAVVTIRRQRVPRGALANEGPNSVLASTVAAQERHHVTLVDVHAVIIVAQLEARIAVTLVLSHHVDASAVVAYVGVSETLVDVYAGVPRRCQQVPRVTDALDAPLQVLAVAILTDVRLLDALVDVHAVHEGGAVLVPLGTFALEAAREIDALGVALARVSQALVVVDALVRVDVVDVAPVALTLETSRRVHAFAVFAHRRHQVALVDLDGFVRHRVDDLTGSTSAQRKMFIWESEGSV